MKSAVEAIAPNVDGEMTGDGDRNGGDSDDDDNGEDSITSSSTVLVWNGC